MAAMTRIRASINYIAAEYPDLDCVAFRQALERAYYMGAAPTGALKTPEPAQSTVSFIEKHNLRCFYVD